MVGFQKVSISIFLTFGFKGFRKIYRAKNTIWSLLFQFTIINSSRRLKLNKIKCRKKIDIFADWW